MADELEAMLNSEAPHGQPEDPPARSIRERRQRVLLIVAVAAAVLSTGGLAASTLIKSPSELAAQAEPPPASLITAPVESKELKSTVVFRGGFAAKGTMTFMPKSAIRPDGHGGSSDGDLVVSRQVKRAGETVSAGNVVAEVSYRPVIALRGRVPAVRDLKQGDAGPDVVQLQRALAGLGYFAGGDRAGRFGRFTAAAVVRLYRAIGYPVPLIPKSQKPDDEKKSDKTRPEDQVLVPVAEVMYVPSFPATLAKGTGRVGGEVPDPLVRLTTGGLRLTGRLDQSQKGLVKHGQHVAILAEETGRKAEGEVGSVGRLVTPKGDGVPYLPVSIDPETRWSAKFAGEEDVRLTITSAASDGKVLAVPEAAIIETSDGRSFVERSRRQQRVEVEIGVSVDGMVEVKPQEKEALKAGDEVVVGR